MYMYSCQSQDHEVMVNAYSIDFISCSAFNNAELTAVAT